MAPPVLTVGTAKVQPCEKVKSLGVLIDRHLTMEDHISNVVKQCFSQLRWIYRIRRYLNRKSTETLVHAFVISRLDMYNGLLAGHPMNQIRRLKSVQHACVRLIFRVGRRDHVTPLMKELHWLQIEKRVVFKILLLCHRCLWDVAPEYLQWVIRQYHPNRPLRSEERCLLESPQANVHPSKRSNMQR